MDKDEKDRMQQQRKIVRTPTAISRKKRKRKSPKYLHLRQPAPHIVMAWLRAMYYLAAGQEFSRHGLHWILHPNTPKKPNGIVRPRRPDVSDYDGRHRKENLQ